MHLEVETGGVRSRSAISGKMCISPRCMIPKPLHHRWLSSPAEGKYVAAVDSGESPASLVK